MLMTMTATTTTIATDDDIDDTGRDNDNDHDDYNDDAGDDTSSMTIAIATTAKMPAHQWQRCLGIDDGIDTVSTSSLAAGGRVIK